GLLRGRLRSRRRHRRVLGRPAPAPDPRRPRRGRLPAADLHEADAGPADTLLRGDPAPRCAHLRRGQLQGPVRGDRTRAGAARQPLAGAGRSLPAVTPQRRTALISVAAACALLALKLTAGVASGSLGLVSEALHSGTDLVAALLTFFAIGVSGRPAD